MPAYLFALTMLWNTLGYFWNALKYLSEIKRSFSTMYVLILRRNSPLHGLILVCNFIDFKKIFHPARLFCPARLIFFKNFPTCTFISYCTSIRYTRVHTLINLVIHTDPQKADGPQVQKSAREISNGPD